MVSSTRILVAAAVVGIAMPAVAGWLILPGPIAALLGGAVALSIVWLPTKKLVAAERPAESPRSVASASSARGLAHELNNVLTVVMGNADHILKDDGTDVRRCAATIYDASERGARLTLELLAAARRQASDLPDEPTSARQVA